MSSLSDPPRRDLVYLNPGVSGRSGGRQYLFALANRVPQRHARCLRAASPTAAVSTHAWGPSCPRVARNLSRTHGLACHFCPPSLNPVGSLVNDLSAPGSEDEEESNLIILKR